MNSLALAALLMLMAAACPAALAFRAAQGQDGRWNLIDPSGKLFFSKGCGVVIPKDTAVKPGGDGYDVLPKFKGGKKAWAKAATARLRRYGFNSIGSWSDDALYGEGLAFTHMLALTGYDKNRLVGVWSPDFESKVEAQAFKETARWKNNPELIGYYLDNELPWYGDTGWPGPQNTPLISKYMALAPGPDRSQAEAAVREFYKGAAAPKDGAYPIKLQEAFAARVAERYFSVCGAALKKADPLHLNLGVRFAGQVYDGVAAACGRHVDVVSFNMYSKGGDFNVKGADRVHVLSGKKPMMITEFSYRAMENRSGDKNSAGADVTVPTQEDRAARLKTFLSGGLDLPYLVGYHWFQYFDESPQGRSFDGEDSNYGLVDIHDGEYELLRAAFVEINRAAETLHAKASHVVPADATASREIRLRQIGSMTAPGGPVRAYFGKGPCETPKMFFWNEASAKGGFACDGRAVKLHFDSGTGWGLGYAIAPDQADNIDGSANLLKYGRLRLTAEVPQGLKFGVYFNESGMAGPWEKEYKGGGEADGECWESGILEGRGRRETWVIRLAELVPRFSWGNQNGNRVIDIQAMLKLDLYVPGAQGSGAIRLERLEFIE